MTPALSPFFFYQVAFPQPNGYVKYSHATVSLARKLLFLLLDKFPSEIRNWLLNTIQLFPEGEVNSGGYIPRRFASRYISTTIHRP